MKIKNIINLQGLSLKLIKICFKYALYALPFKICHFMLLKLFYF